MCLKSLVAYVDSFKMYILIMTQNAKAVNYQEFYLFFTPLKQVLYLFFAPQKR